MYIILFYIFNCFRSWDSVASIATGCGLDNQGVRVQVPVGSRIFSSPHHSDRLWGPVNLLSNGYWGFFPQGAKRPQRESDHSPPASAKVKNVCMYKGGPKTGPRTATFNDLLCFPFRLALD
jgi:hypothetical protein